MAGIVGSRSAKLKAVITAFALMGSATGAPFAAAGDNWTSANAPITYKMANPADMMGYSPAPVQQYAPRSAARPATRPVGAPVFDPRRVDQTLYAHQRIGKTYTIAGKSYTPKHQPRYDMVGTASWYGDKFHGKKTASGEKYNKNAMTAAHKTLPLNSLVVVTNLQTGVALTLRINDRGPFIGERIIDLSEAAADIMGIKTTGLGQVRVQYAGPADVNPNSRQNRGLQAQQQRAPQQRVPQNQAMRPVMPAPAPFTAPRPQYQPSAPVVQQPQYNAPAPAVQQPQYQPLRNMQPPVQQYTPQAAPQPNPKAAQLTQPQLQIPKIMNPVSILPNAALPTMPYAIPEAYMPPSNGALDDETVVTMTIKGPIHMAKQGSDGAKALYIPAGSRISDIKVK